MVKEAIHGIRGVLRTVTRAVLCVALFGFAAACQANQSGTEGIVTSNAPSPRVAAFLGGPTLDVIGGADYVETYMLKPALAADPNATGPGAIAGYYWKARGAALDPASLAEFRRLIMDEGSYDFVNTKKCPMVPEFAFRFVKGGDFVDVLVSFQCKMWQFEHGPAKKTEDFDPAADRLKAVVETVFKLD